MDKETVRVVIIVTGKVLTSLIIGEAVARVVTRPILAWRAKTNVNVENIASLFDTMNQRICDLEEKVLGESK